MTKKTPEEIAAAKLEKVVRKLNKLELEWHQIPEEQRKLEPELEAFFNTRSAAPE